MRGGRYRATILGAGLFMALVAGSFGPALTTGATTTEAPRPASEAPGVTPTQITTGSIATLSGPLASDFDAATPGVRAYFNMVNAQGGIDGRKLELAYSLDDGGNPSQFSSLARTLVDQDHVFAVVGVSTAFFSPSYFAQTGTPTYGYNVTGNWSGPPNLFAAGGSVQDYAPLGPYTAWLIHRVHARSVAVMAYNVSVSDEACKAAAKELQAAGVKISYEDLAAPLDGNMAPDVQRISQAGSDFILSCMDVTGNISMARAVQQYKVKATQLWLNGADASVVQRYANLMQGVYFNIQHVPLSAPTKFYPGLATYLTEMKKYSPTFTGDEVALQGWESASLFVAGLRAAGNDLTQQNVVRVTNEMTDFTAGGLTPPANWTTAHTPPGHPPWCSAFIEVKGTKLVPVYPVGHQVFVCFGSANAKNPKTISPPAGTPGT